MLGTAGHVDHGKTALVKLLTGCDTDRLLEEKQRGLTIELGFAPCTMADQRIVGIVDVPGHVDFIRNMVAGAHGVDVVILVVAADDGVMPQTREHLDILTLMGARSGLVALTKIDLVDEEMRELVIDDVRSVLAGTFLAEAPICPLSNITGEGFDGFFTALNAVVAAHRPRAGEGLYRQWIERAFHIPGFGTVLSGIPTSGEVHVGGRLTIVPGGGEARVRRLEVYGQESEVGRFGECVALNVTGIEGQTLHRGMTACQSDAFAAVTMAEADLRLLPSAPAPLKDYAQVHLHVGTGETMARVAMLEGRDIEPGGSELVQLRLTDPLPLAAGDRFVIRTAVAQRGGSRLTTVGGGRIVGTSDIRLRRNRPWTLASLSARRDALDDTTAWCGQILSEAGAPTAPDALARKAQRTGEQAQRALAELAGRGEAVETAPGLYLHRSVVSAARERIREVLDAFHNDNPKRTGLDRGELPARTELEPGVLGLALGALIADGQVIDRGERVGLAGHGPNISPEDERLCEEIERRLREAHLEPPLPEELASAAGISPAKLDEILRLLRDRDLVVPLDRKVVMHAAAVAAAENVLLQLFARKNLFETVEFRDALGVSRKFAVPLLDYFDTRKLTVRSGNLRRPGVEAKRRMA